MRTTLSKEDCENSDKTLKELGLYPGKLESNIFTSFGSMLQEHDVPAKILIFNFYNRNCAKIPLKKKPEIQCF